MTTDYESTMSKIQRALQDAHEWMEELDGDFDEALTEVRTELEEKTDECANLESEIDELKNSVATAQRHWHDADQERAGLRKRLEDMLRDQDMAERENKALRQKLVEAEKREVSLTAQLNVLRKQAGDKANVIDEKWVAVRSDHYDKLLDAVRSVMSGVQS